MRDTRPALGLACLLTAAAALLGACDAGGGAGRSPKLVIPEPTAQGVDAAGAPPVPAYTEAAALVPKVPLGDRESLLAIREVNLDLGRAEEQILVTRETGNAEAPIRVAVVEYDTVTETYHRSWEDVTRATSDRYIRVETADVVGDHSPAIIVRGSDDQNRYTMDIYRRAISAGTRLSYSSIFSVASTGDIEIVVEPRSQAYQAGDADGRPYAIVVTEPDTAAPDSTDIVKTTHQWSTRDRRYLATAPVRVQGEAVEREFLAALFSSDSADAYLAFLEGSWIATSGDGADQGLVHFSPQTNTFQIYSAASSIQEEYRWERADAYYRNVTIRNARNTILRDLTKDGLRSVDSREQIQLTLVSTIDSLDRWRATYHRADEAALVAQLAAPRVEAAAQPAGLYESESGEQIIFEAPRFTWIGARETLAGGFYLYTLSRADRPVLGLLVQGGYNERPRELAYIAEQSTLVETDRVVKTLVLQPAELTVYGARATSDDRLTFRQIQVSTEPQTAR